METPKDHRLLQKPDGKTLLLKTTPTYLIKHRELKLVPNYKLCHMDKCSWYWKVLCMLLEEKVIIKP